MKALLGPRSRAIAVAALVVLGLTGAGLAVSPLLASQTAPAAPPAGQGKLVVYGDVTLFYPPPHPDNCVLRNRFKRGEPVGFRMFVADPSTGGLEESAKLVVHVTVGGMNVDIPMRYRATAAQPERQFWVAKWVVFPVTIEGAGKDHSTKGGSRRSTTARSEIETGKRVKATGGNSSSAGASSRKPFQRHHAISAQAVRISAAP